MTRGGARELNGHFYARARYGQNKRVEVRIPWAKTIDEARERAVVIAELSDMLAGANRGDLVKGFARELSLTRDPKHVAKVRKAVEATVSGAARAGAGRDITFWQWAQRWTSGELSKTYPDHVPVKDWDDDESRLRLYINPHVRDVPIHAFTVAHGDQVMAKLPLTNAASRRHIAQVMRRVLSLAVYPGKLIAANPLPVHWMPRLSKRRRQYACLWPEEEATLLGHEATPLAFRLLVGVLNREGMRLAEALDSEWWQWNLDVGTFNATKTKTCDPRFWALRPDVARAMRAWHKLHPEIAKPFAEVLTWCPDRTQLAGRLRAALKAAGVTRHELFHSTETSGKLRAHDLRATFVTMSLAEGKGDTWIRDRTAHKSTSMLDRYRRAARQVAELELGRLELLDLALKLSRKTPSRGGGKGGGRPSKTKRGRA